MNLSKDNTRKMSGTFWNMWSHELPVSFPKIEMVDELAFHWGITRSSAYKRLKLENFVSLKSDLSFLFNRYGIAFDFKEKGFFLDQRQYDLIRQNEELKSAKLFGLSK